MGMRIAAALAFTVLATAAVIAYASRNSSGTMAAANGPYVAGTVISSTVVNARFSDIETEITDSLSRSGKGGMTAPLRTLDGSAAAPAHSFTSETNSGLYRVGAGDLGLSIAGTKLVDWTANSQALTISGSATTQASSALEASLSNGNSIYTLIGRTVASNDSGSLQFVPNATAANSTLCMNVTGAAGLCVDGNAKTIIGTSGTGIGGSFRGTTTSIPGSVGANACLGSSSITVTGAVTGADCMVGNSAGTTGLSLTCSVTGTNAAVIQFCNGTGSPITPTAGTYSVRVFNP